MSMTQDEKIRLTDIIQGAAELLNRELSPIALVLYVKTLEDLDFNEASKAFSAIISESKFFPAPAEVRERVIGPPEKLEDLAIIEAAKVVAAISRYGHYESVVFDDPVTMAVIQQQFGGWERACEKTEEEDKFWRKDFVKAYCTFARAGIHSFGVLYGAHDRINGANGFDNKTEPVLIGDRQRALQVWEGNYERTRLDDCAGSVRGLLAGIVGK
jgi:hypothetical protein